MKFDIARQPLVPAFLTLLLLTVVMVWGAGEPLPTAAEPDSELVSEVASGETSSKTSGPAPGMASGEASGETSRVTSGETSGPAPGVTSGETSEPTPGVASGVTPEETSEPASRVTSGEISEEISEVSPGLVVRMPATLLHQLQTAHPALTRWIGALLILLGGLGASRLALRTNLYAVSSCLTLPLYGIGIAAAGLRGDWLADLTACTLLVFALRNYCRSFGNGYRFDALFRASLYLGTLLLLRAALLPLLLLLPLAVLIFHRTLREVVVACVGLLLPAATLCYVNWGCGGSFTAPLLELAPTLCGSAPLALLPRLAAPEALPHTIFSGAISLLALFAAFHARAELLSIGMKPRFVLIYLIITLLVLVLLLGGPDATPADTMLLAVPAALLIPFTAVRITPRIVGTIYLLLVAAAFGITFIQ